jgi:hypothetical protein
MKIRKAEPLGQYRTFEERNERASFHHPMEPRTEGGADAAFFSLPTPRLEVSASNCEALPKKSNVPLILSGLKRWGGNEAYARWLRCLR